MLLNNVSGLDKNAALSIAIPFLVYFVKAFKYRQTAAAAGAPRCDVTLVKDQLIAPFKLIVSTFSYFRIPKKRVTFLFTGTGNHFARQFTHSQC